MTIYAVTDGDYSDYHIVALTVNKERAEHIAKFYKTAEIEEYEDAQELPENPMWECEITENSTVWADLTETYDPAMVEGVKEEKHSYLGTYYIVHARAEDEAHAMEKARDILEKYKAEQEGIT